VAVRFKYTRLPRVLRSTYPLESSTKTADCSAPTGTRDRSFDHFFVTRIPPDTFHHLA
jgi:hypothetical protein